MDPHRLHPAPEVPVLPQNSSMAPFSGQLNSEALLRANYDESLDCDDFYANGFGTFGGYSGRTASEEMFGTDNSSHGVGYRLHSFAFANAEETRYGPAPVATASTDAFTVFEAWPGVQVTASLAEKSTGDASFMPNTDVGRIAGEDVGFTGSGAGLTCSADVLANCNFAHLVANNDFDVMANALVAHSVADEDAEVLFNACVARSVVDKDSEVLVNAVVANSVAGDCAGVVFKSSVAALVVSDNAGAEVEASVADLGVGVDASTNNTFVAALVAGDNAGVVVDDAVATGKDADSVVDDTVAAGDDADAVVDDTVAAGDDSDALVACDDADSVAVISSRANINSSVAALVAGGDADAAIHSVDMDIGAMVKVTSSVESLGFGDDVGVVVNSSVADMGSDDDADAGTEAAEFMVNASVADMGSDGDADAGADVMVNASVADTGSDGDADAADVMANASVADTGSYGDADAADVMVNASVADMGTDGDADAGADAADVMVNSPVTNSVAGADLNVLSKAFFEYVRSGANSIIKTEFDFSEASYRILKATRKINGDQSNVFYLKSYDCDESPAAMSSAPSIRRMRSFYRARNVINGQQEVATETPNELPESSKTLLKQRKVSARPSNEIQEASNTLSERKKLFAKPSKTLKPSQEIRATVKPAKVATKPSKTTTVQPVKVATKPSKTTSVQPVKVATKPSKPTSVQPVKVATKPSKTTTKRPRDSALALAHREDDDFQAASLEELLTMQKVYLEASNAAIKKLKERV